MSISFFDDLGGLFAFWLTFVTQIAQPNHQKLNVIQKWEFIFWWLMGPLFAFQLSFHHSDCSANHQKLNIIQKWAFHFWWLRGPFFAFFGWLLLLRLLSQSSEVESNPKMSIWFLMTYGAFFTFWLTFVAQIAQLNHQKLNVIQKWELCFDD